MRPFMSLVGQTLNIVGEIVVDMILGSELVQEEVQVVRGMAQQLIVVLWFNGAHAHLLRKHLAL